MSKRSPDELSSYLRAADSWATDRESSARSALLVARLTAGALGSIALVEAIAIAIMMPLKTIEPYTLLVDRQTGYVEALKPLERSMIAPDRALARSFLAQYVIAREGFDIDSLREDYRKVALWSTGEARDQYIKSMQMSSVTSPISHLPRRTLVNVEVRGISSLSGNTSLIRFVTVRTDPNAQAQPSQPWEAVVSYRFSGAAMSAADRLLNPIGFQVTRYQKDAELPLEASVSGNDSTRSPIATTAGPAEYSAPLVRPIQQAATAPRRQSNR